MSLEELRKLRRRVVVTGYGVVTPIGNTVDEYWASLVAGRSGIGPVQRFDASDLPVRIAGEVKDFDPVDYMPKPLARRLDSFSQYGLAAAVQAAEMAKLPVGEGMGERTGVIVGSGYGAANLVFDSVLRMHEKGPRIVSPMFAATSGIDNPAGEIAIRFGATGPSGAMSTACATGNTCVGEAARMIQYGVADVMFAGATDNCLNRLDVTSTARAGALSQRNDEPEKASRPFDVDRDGFVMSAGAGVLVLEEAGHAERRGAPILAEFLGYGATTDAHHMTAPHPEGLGAKNAIRRALEDAGVEPDEIDYVNAHGTSTKLNDTVELGALREVLGEHATRIPVSSVKSMQGHLMGAAGAVELVATIEAMRAGVVPPTINLDNPEVTDFNLVPHRAQEWTTRTAMSNSFGFGGRNAVVVVRRYEG
ncbi:3-oxoacyl-[acyl-carrier-protein] synthase II [Streptoalloteichus tenebrarius]|uniref:3-oxoacyl-[acyl-carrier-protein] synthase 2 n=1 Tax=Streptoalloteichus tenebrarius (strain ATCC 17920 / DSM 40477 / JCM 4838 / CBS 697.72 / NBRC 16177 / NCIMB 11028 / NRRL B-12390 / A12253. 1 / ISP 5477) TaxID=1933 RepID=A0ABT1HU79_STRSD|nr:beta-ketoacyl-ACP synthase II [Streptoalloteichus tenebrarius]MCP2259042.1 3-oxoacyl-[acyl-carrier-protein] synthase II [Streptoalloteichus tenebrarius]BFE99632.1 beta-ketoacyl-ACP synthase II [Streptoalloteichus tenebrarius]